LKEGGLFIFSTGCRIVGASCSIANNIFSRRRDILSPSPFFQSVLFVSDERLFFPIFFNVLLPIFQVKLNRINLLSSFIFASTRAYGLISPCHRLQQYPVRFCLWLIYLFRSEIVRLGCPSICIGSFLQFFLRVVFKQQVAILFFFRVCCTTVPCNCSLGEVDRCTLWLA